MVVNLGLVNAVVQRAFAQNPSFIAQKAQLDADRVRSSMADDSQSGEWLSSLWETVRHSVSDGFAVYSDGFSSFSNRLQSAFILPRSTVTDASEYALTAVVVEDQFYTLTAVRRYCEDVQVSTGGVCLRLRWKGESPSELVRVFQDLYFEGLPLTGDKKAVLNTIVLVGTIPLPVVMKGNDFFASLYPYVDLVDPAYVYDERSQLFVATPTRNPIPEIAHGIIRPTQQGDVGRAELVDFFDKNHAFHSGDPTMTTFERKVGYGDMIRSAQIFDPIAYSSYLDRLKHLEELVYYRYTGELLGELSGEASATLDSLLQQDFSNSPIQPDRSLPNLPGLPTQRPAPGSGNLQTPDVLSAGPINSLLKQVPDVFARHVSEVNDVFSTSGRKYDGMSFPQLVEQQDRISALTIRNFARQLEVITKREVEKIAQRAELVESFNYLDDQMAHVDQPVMTNGVSVTGITNAEQCSLLRGSEDGEGQLTLSHKGSSPGSTDTSNDWTLCKNQLRPGDDPRSCDLLAKSSLLNYGSGDLITSSPALTSTGVFPYPNGDDTIFGADRTAQHDYRECFDLVTPLPHEKIDRFRLRSFSSVTELTQPTGELVRAQMMQPSAPYMPIDAERKIRFYRGGLGKMMDSRVGEIVYPNLFAIDSAKPDAIRRDFQRLVQETEKKLYQEQVEVLWQQFEKYLALSSPEVYREDFWNAGEIDGFSAQFAQYRVAVEQLLRGVYGSDLQIYELTRQWILGGAGVDGFRPVPPAVQQQIDSLLSQAFPNAQAVEQPPRGEISSISASLSLLRELAQGGLSSHVGEGEELCKMGLQLSTANVTLSCNGFLRKQAGGTYSSLFDFSQADDVHVKIYLQHHWDDKLVLKNDDAKDKFQGAVYTLANPIAATTLGVGLFAEGVQLLVDSFSNPDWGNILEHWEEVMNPVLLSPSSPYADFAGQIEDQLTEEVHYRHLGLESKFQELLPKLVEGKEMSYLMFDSDSEGNVVFRLPYDFEDDALPTSVQNMPGSVSGIESEYHRLMNSRPSGSGGDGPDSQGVPCKDSAPLLGGWIEEVACWAENVVKGPFITYPADDGNDVPLSESESESVSVSVSPESTVAMTVSSLELDRDTIAMGEQPSVRVRLIGADRLVSLTASGSVSLAFIGSGEGVLTPRNSGSGTVRAVVQSGSSQITLQKNVQVVSYKAFVGPRSADPQVIVGGEDQAEYWVEVRDSSGEIIPRTFSLSLEFLQQDQLVLAHDVVVANGVGSFSLSGGTVSGLAGFRVGSNLVASSSWEYLSVRHGDLHHLSWDFGDEVFGDDEIQGTITARDRFDNSVRSEAVKVTLSATGASFPSGLSSDDFYLLNGEVVVSLTKRSGNSGVSVRVDSVDGLPDVVLPPEQTLDARGDWLVMMDQLPSSARVDESLELHLSVKNAGGQVLPLFHHVFSVKSEKAGEVVTTDVAMNGSEATVSFPAGTKSGSLTFSISDNDFGLASKRVMIEGGDPSSFDLSFDSHTGDQVQSTIRVKDSYGNFTKAPQPFLLTVQAFEQGGGILMTDQKSFSGESLSLDLDLPRPSDRVKVTVRSDSISEVSAVSSIRLRLSADDISRVPWSSPFVVLGGGGYGSWLNGTSLAQSFLYAPGSSTQAIVTELSAGRELERLASVFPSGKVLASSTGTLEVFIDNSQPLIVIRDDQQEIGRVRVSPSWPELQMISSLDNGWKWTRALSSQVLLKVLEGTLNSTATGKELMHRGQKLLEYQTGRGLFVSPDVQVELLSEPNEALILEFSLQKTPFAVLYLDVGANGVSVSGQTSVTFSASSVPGYSTEVFYADTSTEGRKGLRIVRSDVKQSTGVGFQRPGLHRVDDTPSLGWGGENKLVLYYGGGNSVGESTRRVLGEGEAVFGDPTLSLHEMKSRLSGGATGPALDNASAGTFDFTPGQLLWSGADVDQLLKVDLNGDEKKDLLMVIAEGEMTKVRYLEKDEDGKPFGDVGDVVLLKGKVSKIHILDGKHLLVLYQSGEVGLEEFLNGKYVKRPFSFDANGKRLTLRQLLVVDLDNDGMEDVVVMDGGGTVYGFYGRVGDHVVFESAVQLGDFAVRSAVDADLLGVGGWVNYDGIPQRNTSCSSVDNWQCTTTDFRPLPLVSGPTPTVTRSTHGSLSAFQQSPEDIARQLRNPPNPLQGEAPLLVRFKRVSDLQSVVRFSTDLSGDRRLVLGQAVNAVFRFQSPSTLRNFTFGFDLGDQYSVQGSPTCMGCGSVLVLSSDRSYQFLLRGTLVAGQSVEVTVPLMVSLMPKYFLNQLETNNDGFPDVAVNIENNRQGEISVIESRGARRYEVIPFSTGTGPVSDPLVSAQQQGDAIQQRIQDLTTQMQAAANAGDADAARALGEQMQGLFDGFPQWGGDSDHDGYPDAFQYLPGEPLMQVGGGIVGSVGDGAEGTVGVRVGVDSVGLTPGLSPILRDATEVGQGSIRSQSFDGARRFVALLGEEDEHQGVRRESAGLEQLSIGSGVSDLISGVSRFLGNGNGLMASVLSEFERGDGAQKSQQLESKNEHLNQSLSHVSELTSGQLENIGKSAFRRLVGSWFPTEAKAADAVVNEDYNATMDDVNRDAEKVKSDTQRIVNSLVCSAGCLPVPINMAFLAPGQFHLFGIPLLPDSGIPAIAFPGPAWSLFIPIPFLPNIAHRASLFRIYLAPTLTLGLGMAMCAGVVGFGSCFVFTLPIEIPGTEGICDSIKSGLRSIVAGIVQAVGEVKAAVTGALNETGIVEVSPSRGASDDEIGAVMELDIGSGSQGKGPIQIVPPKIKLDPFPKIFVEWWDRQWEEIINSLTDIPDITLRLPDFGKSLGDQAYWDQVSAKASATANNFGFSTALDLIDSLPILDLIPQPIRIIVPWIEPGILARMQTELYLTLHSLMVEMLEFMKSFNVPCLGNVSGFEWWDTVESHLNGNEDEKKQMIVDFKNVLSDSGDVITEMTENEAVVYMKGQMKGAGLPSGLVDEPKFQELILAVRAKQIEIKAGNQHIDRLKKELEDLGSTDALSVKGHELLLMWNALTASWTENTQGLDNPSGSKQKATARDAGQCLGQKIALDVGLNYMAFINGLLANLEALKAWKLFPRQLAKYLNILDYYVSEVIRLLDEVIGQFTGWWSTISKQIDLWMDAIMWFQQFLALVNTIIKLLEGYHDNCTLCKSDRLTLKDLIMKILFGAIPSIPVIPFPTWPDVMLDFTKIQLGAELVVPTFDLQQVNLTWPAMPKIKLPRYGDFDFDVGLKFNVSLPSLANLVPPPPELPPLPLPPLPHFPRIKLPTLPPAPELPDILGPLLPVLKLIETVLTIWCLVNRLRVPIPEAIVKQQVENLTDRSLHLLLTIDLLLNLQLTPPQVINDLVPFDLIKVETLFKAFASYGQEDLDALQDTVEENFNQPATDLVNGINSFAQGLMNRAQQGMNEQTSDFQRWLNQYQLQDFDVNLEGEAGIGADGSLYGGYQGTVGGQELYEFGQTDGTVNQEEFRRELLKGTREVQDQLNHDAQGRVPQLPWLKNLRNEYVSYLDSIRSIQRARPDEQIAMLSNLSGEHLLASSGIASSADAVSAVKKKVQESAPFEKKIALVNREELQQGFDDLSFELSSVGESLLGVGEPDPSALGPLVTDGDTMRKLQDYPIPPGSAMQVEGDTIFTAYEGDVFAKVKQRSGSSWKLFGESYSGVPLSKEASDFGKTSLHFLKAQSLEGQYDEAGMGTLRWSWMPGEERHVELQVWDQIGAANQEFEFSNYQGKKWKYVLDQEPAPQVREWKIPSSAQELVSGRALMISDDVQLSIGDDALEVDGGVSLQIPVLSGRAVSLSGSGSTQLNLVSGEEYQFTLSDGVSLEVRGLLEGMFTGPGTIVLPRVTSARYLRSFSGLITGNLYQRIVVERDQVFPDGDFYATEPAVLENGGGDRFRIDIGLLLPVRTTDRWKLISGAGHVITGDQLSDASSEDLIVDHLVLTNGDELFGEYSVQSGDELIRVDAQERVVFSTVRSSSMEVHLPFGYFYGRLWSRAFDRALSPVVTALSEERHGDVSVLGGTETIRVPLYVPVQIDGRDYVLGTERTDSFVWQGEEGLLDGYLFDHIGYTEPGNHSVTLHVRAADESILDKSFVVEAYVPAIHIDEARLQRDRVLSVQVTPPYAGIPIGIVSERNSAQKYVLDPPSKGTLAGDRYLTATGGLVELQPFEGRIGQVITLRGGEVVRIFDNGRVEINDSYQQLCRKDASVSIGDQIQVTVMCRDSAGVEVPQFNVLLQPSRDTDVIPVSQWTGDEWGVSVLLSDQRFTLEEIDGSASFVPGGVRLMDASGQPLLYLSNRGEVIRAQSGITVREKAYSHPLDAVIFEVILSESVVAEVQIVPDHPGILQRDGEGPVVPRVGDANSNGLLDAWEQTYSVTDPNGDDDSDGLTNREEYLLGTDPRNSDTDRDGKSDGEEVHQGGDALFQGDYSRPTEEDELPFTDIAKNNAYYDAVDSLYRMGFLQGYEDNTVRVEKDVTRAEAVKLLMSLLKCENCSSPSEATREQFDPTDEGWRDLFEFHGVDEEATRDVNGEDSKVFREALRSMGIPVAEIERLLPRIGTYYDVPIEEWFYFCVEIATSLGIVQGYRGDVDGVNAIGSFQPGRKVSLPELMKMTIEAMGEKGAKSSRVYGPPAAWWNNPENNYMAKAEELGLLLNVGAYQEVLRPATRGEVIYALDRVFKVLKGEEDGDKDGVVNSSDQCPCIAAGYQDVETMNGCPVPRGEIPGGLSGGGLTMAPTTTGAGPTTSSTTTAMTGAVSTRIPGTTFQVPSTSTTGIPGVLGGVPDVSPMLGGGSTRPRELLNWNGIIVEQLPLCDCLAVDPADVLKDMVFFSVITGVGDLDTRVYGVSNRARVED